TEAIFSEQISIDFNQFIRLFPIKIAGVSVGIKSHISTNGCIHPHILIQDNIQPSVCWYEVPPTGPFRTGGQTTEGIQRICFKVVGFGMSNDRHVQLDVAFYNEQEITMYLCG